MNHAVHVLYGLLHCPQLGQTHDHQVVQVVTKDLNETGNDFQAA